MRLVDKAARALAEAGGADWEALTLPEQARFRRGARAVLDALRDPDEEMAEAGAEIIRTVGPHESEVAYLNDAVNTWRYMIDALRGKWK